MPSSDRKRARRSCKTRRPRSRGGPSRRTDGEDGKGDGRNDECARAAQPPPYTAQKSLNSIAAIAPRRSRCKTAPAANRERRGEPPRRLEHLGTLHDHLPFHVGGPRGNAALREATFQLIRSTRPRHADGGGSTRRGRPCATASSPSMTARCGGRQRGIPAVLPKWGLTMLDATLVEWLKQEGERVEVDDHLPGRDRQGGCRGDGARRGRPRSAARAQRTRSSGSGTTLTTIREGCA